MVADNKEELEEAEVAALSQSPIVEVQLSEPTVRRIRALYQEREALSARIQETLVVALEAMGTAAGQISNVNIDTGIVTLLPLAAEPPKLRAVPNREIRRAVSRQRK